MVGGGPLRALGEATVRVPGASLCLPASPTLSGCIDLLESL